MQALFFINQIFFFPALEHGNHGRSKLLCACQIVQQIIAALNAARARNLAFVSGDKRHALLHERNRIRRLHIAHKEVEAGLTAHRAAVDDLIGKLRVACIRCKQVLERMPRRRLDVSARIRIHHANVIGGNVTVETVVLLSHKKADSYIHIDVEFGEGEGKIPVDSIAKRAEAYKPKEKVTYKMIKEYIEAKYGFKVHTAYIAEVKRDLGLPMYDAPNAVEELKQPRKHPTPEKVEAIKDALRYFAVI